MKEVCPLDPFTMQFIYKVNTSVVIDKSLVDTLPIKHNCSQNPTFQQGCSVVDKSNTTES